ncbi:hypothetical protein ILYODFUR_015393 [Ilyodon furcidens]|uniref:Uncharacterized protein n=1 Tax=Ilyodon furcidens TaxID=33524 RepID=A0ABV0T8A5_9TELE
MIQEELTSVRVSISCMRRHMGGMEICVWRSTGPYLIDLVAPRHKQRRAIKPTFDLKAAPSSAATLRSTFFRPLEYRNIMSHRNVLSS